MKWCRYPRCSPRGNPACRGTFAVPGHALSLARRPGPGPGPQVGLCPSPPATPTSPQEEAEARQLPPDLLDKLVHVRHGRFIVLPSELLAVQGQEVWPVSVDDLRRRGRRQGGPTLGRGPQGPVLRPQGAPGLSGMLVTPPMAGGPVSAMEQRAGPRGQPS